MGDEYEDEADRVADEVVSASAPTASASEVALPSPETNPVRAAAVPEIGLVSPEMGEAIAGHLIPSAPGGQPLAAATRSFMESRMGADFSAVRVHADQAAASLTRQLSARAFTHGPDIYMAAGKYEPGSPTGQQLLAHELTHA